MKLGSLMIYLKFRKVLEASFSTLIVLNLISFFFVGSIASIGKEDLNLGVHIISLGGPIVFSCILFTIWSSFLFKRVILPYIQKIFELERVSNQQKLAAQISHDLKSPLAVLDVLNQNLSEENELLGEAITRIRKITKELIESDLDDEEIQVKHFLEDVLKYKKLEYPRLKLQLDADTDFSILGCRSNLSRVFSNLINNSVEANASTVIIKVHGSSLHRFIVVEDDGVGISNTPKFYFKRGNSTKLKNSGLGLTGAKAYLEKIGAEIIISNLHNKTGAKVEIMFRRLE